MERVIVDGLSGHVIDFQVASEKWCREARRNRQAFLIASVVAVVMALTAIAGWAR